MGASLSGNEEYFSLPNGDGTRYMEGDQISRDPAVKVSYNYLYTVRTSLASCSNEVSFELDLRFVLLGRHYS
jgi:hypothetical protein